MEVIQEEKKKKKYRLLRLTYFTILHLLSIFAVFLMLTALAVKFKWTNEKGNVDINNRYFSSMAKQYGSDLKSKKANLAREESILLQKIGLLAKYSPLDAAKESALKLLSQLDKRDWFSLVTFDDTARVVVPMRRIGDHDLVAVKQ